MQPLTKPEKDVPLKELLAGMASSLTPAPEIISGPDAPTTTAGVVGVPTGAASSMSGAASSTELPPLTVPQVERVPSSPCTTVESTSGLKSLSHCSPAVRRSTLADVKLRYELRTKCQGEGATLHEVLGGEGPPDVKAAELMESLENVQDILWNLRDVPRAPVEVPVEEDL